MHFLSKLFFSVLSNFSEWFDELTLQYYSFLVDITEFRVTFSVKRIKNNQNKQRTDAHGNSCKERFRKIKLLFNA